MIHIAPLVFISDNVSSFNVKTAINLMDSFLGNMDENLSYLYNIKEEDAQEAVAIMRNKGKKSYDELFRIQKIAKKYKESMFDDL